MSERGNRLDIDWLLAIMDAVEQDMLDGLAEKFAEAGKSDVPMKIFVSTPNRPTNKFWEMCKENKQ